MRGFTLLEMMIVLAIIAILALMLAPSYHQQSIRAQIAEALPLADLAKGPVALSWSAKRSFPADNAAAGLPPAEKIVNNLVSSVAVQAGAIHITFGNRAYSRIRGRVLTLRPAVVEDAPIVPVEWVCGYAAPPDKMTVRGANKTDVEKDYLPGRCK